MSEPLLAIRSALAANVAPGHHGAIGSSGATLTELTGLTLASLAVRSGHIATLSASVEREFGLALPRRPGYAAKHLVEIIWSGCDHWLAIGTPNDNLAQRLATCVDSSGSVTGLTGSRTIVRIGGPRARDGLMKIVPVDLDEGVFTTGSAAVTVAAHIPVLLWQIDTSPAYRIVCPRSYGVSLWNALSAAFAEYGFEMKTGHEFNAHNEEGTDQ